MFNASGVYTIKIYGCNIQILVIVRVFVLGKPYQTSLMFVGEARSHTLSGAPERCFTWVGYYRIKPEVSPPNCFAATWTEARSKSSRYSEAHLESVGPTAEEWYLQ
jgi:hypothetical protein